MLSNNVPFQEDQTPLHIASRLGKTDIVQLLLQHMAHPDAATTNGYTPLHISAREGQFETAAVLLEAGASHSLATKVNTRTDAQINAQSPCIIFIHSTVKLVSFG